VILFYFTFNCGDFSPFCENILDNEYPVSNSLFLWENHFREKRKNLLKVIAKNHLSCLDYERVLKIFYFSYFGYCQFWLNTLMGDRHFSNVTKFRGKRKKHISKWKKM
jgi:hypothetical protein